MGQAIIAAAERQAAVIAHTLDVGDDAAACIRDCDAVIDFSFHSATLPLIKLAAEAGKPVVIGTTGHSEEEKEAIRNACKDIPVVWAGNYSVGVNLLNYLTGKAAKVLGNDYNPEVIEFHHRMKKDAPSGTADRLVEIVREARDLTREQEAHGRKGIVGERPTDEIGVHAVRGGDIVGEHTVYFIGMGERIELTHKATDRRIFAEGAVRAAQWIVGKPANIYDMQDVLELKD